MLRRAEHLAARETLRLLRLLPFLCRRRAGFLRLPVGRHVARGRLHRHVLCAGGIVAGLGGDSPPIAPACSCCSGSGSASTSSPAWSSCQRRSAMAQLHRHGRVLPERPAAHLDRMVRPASAALVPCGFTHWRDAVMELGLVFMLFLPRAMSRIACFFIVTPWQIGVILTANYTFLNYLVLLLGFLLLDDQFLARFVPERSAKGPRCCGRAASDDGPIPSFPRQLARARRRPLTLPSRFEGAARLAEQLRASVCCLGGSPYVDRVATPQWK